MATKYTIWPKASVIMMKYAPLVRRQTIPVSHANSIDKAIAAGNATRASLMPWEDKYADSVGAESDERRVAEGNQAGIADQEIERDCGDREHHHAGAEIQQIMPCGPVQANDRQQREREESQRRAY